MRKRTKIRKRRRWEAWQRRRVLYICIIVSALIHLSIFVSISPWWLEKAPKVKPRKVKAVTLKIKPRRLAPPRVPAKAPPRPAVVKPPERAPAPKPVYTEKQLKKSLAAVRSEEVPRKFARPKSARVREVIERKEKEARTWVDKEIDALDKMVEREEAGEVGYSRIVDLSESSDYQVGRLLDHFGMSVGCGSRKITDFNIQFVTEWSLTPGQIRNYLSRYDRSNYREITAAIAGATSDVALKESGGGPPRPFISPTVDAMAAILVAEEEYFASTGDDPDEMERLVFGPIWTYKGPAFKVVKSEKKEAAEQKPAEEKRDTAK